MLAMSRLEDFHLVPVKFDETCRASHIIYIKQHQVRENEASLPQGRTLFVVGVPPLCTEEALRNVFAVNGEVSRVYMRKRPGLVSTESTDCLSSQSRSLKGFKVGYVVFKESPGLRNALGMDPSVERYLSTPSCQIATGMKKWIHEYRSKWPDPSSLQVEIDDYMIKFDEKSKQEREEQQAKQGQPDDEGWVTITRTKKAFKPNETNRREMLRTKKKRKQKELLNFYQFQQRETKRDQIAQLRKKFEEDKHKIATMRATRKFRPYN